MKFKDKRKLKSQPIRVLKELEISELSLVDRGSNEGAKVMFWKREHGARQLWEAYVDEVLSVHNKTLREQQKNPPKGLSLEAVEALQQKKPWSRDQAAQAARKTGDGQQLWQQVMQEAQPPLSKGIRVYTDLEQITKDTRDDILETKGESYGAVKKMLEGRVKKSDYQADFNQLLLIEMSRPTWNEYYTEYSKKPDVTDKEIQKREYDYAAAWIEIDQRAKRLVAKGESPNIAQATVEICRRFPELERKYRESQ